jgi:hypothetical protein
MPELESVFAELSSILRPYAAKLETKADSQTALYVDTRYIMKNKKPLFFGAVQIKKNYVSFHLMPVYVQPTLLDSVSSDLKRRMQGKSCFAFTSIDKDLFRELAGLTKAGYASYQEQGYA